MSDSLPENLQLLCKHYTSIADVCRRLNINRAQFNKYLNGQSTPSPYNLKRICDFFGVEELEINLSTEKFSDIIAGGKTRSISKTKTAAQEIFERLQKHSSDEISDYIGYYHEYYHSMSAPGYILCSLVYLRELDGSYIYSRNERIQSFSLKVDEGDRYSYQGAAYCLKGRFFFVDYESLTSNEISQTILVPSYKSRINRLNGLKIGVSSGDQRTPACTRVVWDYLGKEINRIEAYRHVRLYHPDDPALDADLRERLSKTEIVNGLFKMT
ncbi:helix-turn-helix domain-containing protein [Pseudomonas sp. KB_15]|uniref:helix-turn-helix domain-containing protein n=1 Tax=Pseudomonas sp. KB_15 TaxID=3233035 RepID=UPI003F9626AC